MLVGADSAHTGETETHLRRSLSATQRFTGPADLL